MWPWGGREIELGLYQGTFAAFVLKSKIMDHGPAESPDVRRARTLAGHHKCPKLKEGGGHRLRRFWLRLGICPDVKRDAEIGHNVFFCIHNCHPNHPLPFRRAPSFSDSAAWRCLQPLLIPIFFCCTTSFIEEQYSQIGHMSFYHCQLKKKLRQGAAGTHTLAGTLH